MKKTGNKLTAGKKADIIVILVLVAALILIIIGSLFNSDTEVIEVPATLSELAGKTVGVQSGTLYEETLLDKCPDAQIEYYSDCNTMILAVEQGKLDAYLTETSCFPIESQNHPGMVLIDEPCDSVDVGPAMAPTAKGKALQSQMNEFIYKCNNDGTFDELWSYWMDDYDQENCDVDLEGFSGENGTLTIAVEGGYEPFSFVKNGKLIGYDVDFFSRFCRAYGYTPEFVTLTYEATAPALLSDRIQIGISLINEERAEELLLCEPHYSYNVVAAVYTGNVSEETFWESISDSFEKTFIREDRWKLFAEGTGITLLIGICSLVLGTVLGFVLYLIKYNYRGKIIKAVIGFFSGLLHVTPAVVLLMVVYYIIFAKIDINAIIVAIISFGLVYAASMISMMEAGVMAVGTGQMEAARSQGFSHNGAFFRIILPQAARHFLPTYRDEIVSLIKETSVVGYIAITDLTKMSDLVRGRTFEAFFPLIVTTIIYALISLGLIACVRRVQITIDPKKRKKEVILKGIDTGGHSV